MRAVGDGPIDTLNFRIRPVGGGQYCIVDDKGNEVVAPGVLRDRHACKAFMKGAEYAINDLRWFLERQANAMNTRLITTPGDKSAMTNYAEPQ